MEKELEIAGLKDSLVKVISLLNEALYVLNQVPNKKYYTSNGTKNHYELCERIEKFLNINKNEMSAM